VATLTLAERAHFAGWDTRIAKHARRIRLLGPLSWPLSVEADFFSRPPGQRRLPDPPAPRFDHDDERRALEEALGALDDGHPIGEFLARTARSYLAAADMLQAAGSPAFTERSRRLYGSPREAIAPGAPTHLEAAEQFLRASEGCDSVDINDGGMPAAEAAAWLQAQLARYFPDPLPVELAPALAAKSTAGARRVRLRDNTTYSQRTLAQLLQHEALVHSATKRNGLAQPLIRCLGLSAPRTTATQEGLATLAEMITDTMDLHRLRRIALRITAIDVALEGGDFFAVFETFTAHGQSEVEAFRSAARIFRGGDVRGSIVFTKDVVYLKGLMRVHTFLLKAIQSGHRRLPARLFAGRMTLHDALTLEPFFDSGDLTEAVTLPDWVRNVPCLAAYLSWAAFSNRIPLDKLTLNDFRRDQD